MSPAAPRIESLSIPGPAGVLEGILKLPASAIGAAALLCHPHPLYQGSMHSPVIFRAARALHRRSYATLRFNFRGVGRSAGSYDGGRGEKQDVLASLETLIARMPKVPVALVGYSFGSRVGLDAVAGDARVSRLIGIGVPLALGPMDFLKGIDKPLLVIQGDQDQFGALPDVQRLVRTVGSSSRLILIRGADHYFNGKLDQLEESLAAALAEKPFSGTTA
ncbi:MAG: alpha/beta fold hydrolase [Acidobacteria bacterium]|nr:alpha/beta fold hydrolase [Acidobacteriota bacterium]